MTSYRLEGQKIQIRDDWGRQEIFRGLCIVTASPPPPFLGAIWIKQLYYVHPLINFSACSALHDQERTNLLCISHLLPLVFISKHYEVGDHRYRTK